MGSFWFRPSPITDKIGKVVIDPFLLSTYSWHLWWFINYQSAIVQIEDNDTRQEGVEVRLQTCIENAKDNHQHQQCYLDQCPPIYWHWLEYSTWIVVLVQNILKYSTWIFALVQVQGSSPFKLMRVLCSKFGWTTDGEVRTQIYHLTLAATCRWRKHRWWWRQPSGGVEPRAWWSNRCHVDADQEDQVVVIMRKKRYLLL